jgi:hypothetical protein
MKKNVVAGKKTGMKRTKKGRVSLVRKVARPAHEVPDNFVFYKI